MFHLLHVVFWSFVLVLALSFFGISIHAIIESPAGQANLAYLTYLIISAWHWVVQYALWVRGQLHAI